ncbi:MAG: hypothetical protein ACLQU1_35380 [Bryobacteraceae bacterium]
MSDIISEYQKWKQQGQELRTQARQAMESRFRELLAEAAQIADEYRADFGAPLKPQPPVTAFRYKSGGKGKGRKVAKPAKPEPKVEAAPAKTNPKVAGLQKRLATAKKKLEDAKSAGSATRVLEDKVYEIEDELRLSAQG